MEGLQRFLSDRFGLLWHIQKTWGVSRAAGGGSPFTWRAGRTSQARPPARVVVTAPARQAPRDLAHTENPAPSVAPEVHAIPLGAATEEGEGSPQSPAVAGAERLAPSGGSLVRVQEGPQNAATVPPVREVHRTPHATVQTESHPRSTANPQVGRVDSVTQHQGANNNEHGAGVADQTASYGRDGTVNPVASPAALRQQEGSAPARVTMQEAHPLARTGETPPLPLVETRPAEQRTEGALRAPDEWTTQRPLPPSPPAANGAEVMTLAVEVAYVEESSVRGRTRRLPDISEFVPIATDRELPAVAMQPHRTRRIETPPEFEHAESIHPATPMTAPSRPMDIDNGHRPLAYNSGVMPSAAGPPATLPHAQASVASRSSIAQGGPGANVREEAPVLQPEVAADSTSGTHHESTAGGPPVSTEEMVDRAVQALARRLAIEAERRGVTQ